MLRTALLRTAAAAVAAQPVLRTSVRRLAARSNIISYAPRPSTSIIPRAAAWTTVRSYSSGGGSLTKDDVTNRIMELLKGFDKVNDTSNITETAHFANDLGLDSLDTVEVVMAIEEEFSIEIPDKDADGIHSIDKAVEYILSQPDAH